MRASCLQSRLVEALEDGSNGAPFFGTYLKGVDPKTVAAEMERAIRDAIIPRLAMRDHPNDFGELEVANEFAVQLSYCEDTGSPDLGVIQELPVVLVMKNFGPPRSVFLDWQPGILAFGTSGDQQRPQVVVFDQPDAVGSLIHWLTWSVAHVFGRDDD